MIVYKITNILTGAAYIGITIKTLGVRYSNHWTRARGRSGRLSLLHRAMMKYGEDAFRIEALACCTSLESLRDCEILLIKEHQTFWSLGGYNLTYGGEGAATGPQSEETKAKRAAANRGKIRSAEQRARISAGSKGRIKSDEHKANWRASVIGYKKTPEAIERSAASRRGKKQSEETIRRRSETLRRINEEKRRAALL